MFFREKNELRREYRNRPVIQAGQEQTDYSGRQAVTDREYLCLNDPDNHSGVWKWDSRDLRGNPIPAQSIAKIRPR